MRNTTLNDRVLWFDGISAFDPSGLLHSVVKYDVTHVTGDSVAVRTFNKHVSKSQEITIKTECEPLTSDWITPIEYRTLNVLEYLSEKHLDLTESMGQDEIDARDLRMVQELVQYEAFGLMDVLRAVIWTINTLTYKDVVWGVGRGSSVSSYVLYVIGVHDVDSFLYDLDVGDFLHD